MCLGRAAFIKRSVFNENTSLQNCLSPIILQQHFPSSLQCTEFPQPQILCPAQGDWADVWGEECQKFCVSFRRGSEWGNGFILLQDVLWAGFFGQDLNVEFSVAACSIVWAGWRQGSAGAVGIVVLPWAGLPHLGSFEGMCLDCFPELWECFVSCSGVVNTGTGGC